LNRNTPNNHESTPQNDSKTGVYSYKLPHTTPTTPNSDFDDVEVKKIGAAMRLVSQSRIEEINQGHIHHQGNTDKFECDSCPIVDDIHYMKTHRCSGIDYNKQGVS
jgi:hypothetical protein